MFYFGNNKLRIILGESCNLKCIYCGHYDSPCNEKPREISEGLFNYLSWLNKTVDRKIKIQYFGGEPLLYWDKIVALTEYASSLPDSIFTFSLVTNGVLLDKEKIDYCNDHDILVCLSWDGHNSSKTRFYDVMKDKEELLYSIDNLGISATLSNRAYVYDVLTDLDVFAGKYKAKTGRSILTNVIYNCDINADSDLMTFDISKLEEQYHKLFEVLRQSFIVENKKEYMEKHDYRLSYANLYINMLKDGIDNKHPHNSFCNIIAEALPIDLDGNILECAHSIKRIGNVITDSSIKLLNAYAQSEKNIMNRRDGMCTECFAEPICQGGCKLIADKDIEPSCTLQKNIMHILTEEIYLTEQFLEEQNV